MKDKTRHTTSNDYDEAYYKIKYQTGCNLSYDRSEPHWLNFFGAIADQIIRSLAPRTVFDAGCALGFLVESLWDRGVEARGMDISDYAIAHVRADMRQHCCVGSLAEEIEGRYDLVVCIEVLEHMSAEHADQAIANFGAISDRVLFSSTPNDFEQETHININPPMVWLKQFQKHGFLPNIRYDASYITPHAILFEKAKEGFGAYELGDALTVFSGWLRMKCAVHEQGEKLRTELRLTRQHVDNIESERKRLVAAEESLKAMTADLESERLRLVAAEESLKAMTADLESERLRLVAAEEGLRVMARRAVTAEENIKWMETSTSWQVTRPLRGAKLMLRPFRKRRSSPVQVPSSLPPQVKGESAASIVSAPNVTAPLIPSEATTAIQQPNSDGYARWVARYDTIGEAERSKLRVAVDALRVKPLISVLMPVYNSDPKWLRAAIESIRRQIYPHWELCLSDDASTLPGVREVMRAAAGDRRIKMTFRDSRGHISANTNSALSLAQGEFIALVDNDDELPEDALYWVAKEIAEYPKVDMIFSDEDKIDEMGRRFDPYFKPDWNPALMLSQNAFSHLGVFRRDLVVQLGGLCEGYEGSQDHDLALRCADVTVPERIRHIPRVLYHWRVLQESTAARGLAAKPYAWVAGKRAILDHLSRQKVEADVEPRLDAFYQVVYAPPPTWPRVTIVIPTTLKTKVTHQCLRGLLDKTSYGNFEILMPVHAAHVAESNATSPIAELLQDPRIRVLTYQKAPFNYSWVNNYAVDCASGEFICFLNDDVEVITVDWLEKMVVRARLAGVGAVGAMLYYPHGTIQHAGVVLGVGGVADHASRHCERGSHGYFGRAALDHDLSCVTAACMVVPRAAFDSVGRFDDDLPCAFNDVDLCMRFRRDGWRILWTSTVEMIHHKSLTFGFHASTERAAQFERDVHEMRRRWGPDLDADPYYNPNLTLEPWRAFLDLAYPPRITPRTALAG